MPYDTNKFTPMWIKHETKKEIHEMKVHPNQSYDEVVSELIEAKRLCDCYEQALIDDGK